MRFVLHQTVQNVKHVVIDIFWSDINEAIVEGEIIRVAR